MGTGDSRTLRELAAACATRPRKSVRGLATEPEYSPDENMLRVQRPSLAWYDLSAHLSCIDLQFSAGCYTPLALDRSVRGGRSSTIGEGR
jgi:hypothetical protein